MHNQQNSTPDLPPDLAQRGWSWHPHLPGALVQYADNPKQRVVLDVGDPGAAIAAARRRIKPRGRPKKRGTT